MEYATVFDDNTGVTLDKRAYVTFVRPDGRKLTVLLSNRAETPEKRFYLIVDKEDEFYIHVDAVHRGAKGVAFGNAFGQQLGAQTVSTFRGAMFGAASGKDMFAFRCKEKERANNDFVDESPRQSRQRIHHDPTTECIRITYMPAVEECVPLHTVKGNFSTPWKVEDEHQDGGEGGSGGKSTKEKKSTPFYLAQGSKSIAIPRPSLEGDDGGLVTVYRPIDPMFTVSLRIISEFDATVTGLMNQDDASGESTASSTGPGPLTLARREKRARKNEATAAKAATARPSYSMASVSALKKETQTYDDTARGCSSSPVVLDGEE